MFPNIYQFTEHIYESQVVGFAESTMLTAEVGVAPMSSARRYSATQRTKEMGSARYLLALSDCQLTSASAPRICVAFSGPYFRYTLHGNSYLQNSKSRSYKLSFGSTPHPHHIPPPPLPSLSCVRVEEYSGSAIHVLTRGQDPHKLGKKYLSIVPKNLH